MAREDDAYMKLAVFGSPLGKDRLQRLLPSGCDVVVCISGVSLGSVFSCVPPRDCVEPGNRETTPPTRCESAPNSAALLGNQPFDVLLYDPVEEALPLFASASGRSCTLSDELVRAGFDPTAQAGQVVPSGSEELFAAWMDGWRALLGVLTRMGRVDALRVVKSRWSPCSIAGTEYEVEFAPTRVASANAFLRRLYRAIEADRGPEVLVEVDPLLMIGPGGLGTEGRPYRFVDEFYHELGRLLLECPSPSDDVRSRAIATRADLEPRGFVPRRERQLEAWKCYAIAPRGSPLEPAFPVPEQAFVTDGRVSRVDDTLDVSFSGREAAYQIKLRMPSRLRGNGLSIVFRLRGWSSIRYAALGYTHATAFRHVKIPNPVQGRWVEFSVGHDDLIFRNQNAGDRPPADWISDLRVYVRGRPDREGAHVDLASLSCWRESDGERPWLLEWDPRNGVSQAVVDILLAFERKALHDYATAAKAFMRDGVCPLFHGVSLAWDAFSTVPEELPTAGHYQFSWHALHPATTLLLEAADTGSVAALCAARELVSGWLERSYFSRDSEDRYTWYDHGTAERSLAFVLVWAAGLEQGFDRRFMLRLRAAMLGHAELLASEGFYAANQPTRYHNHAWFQDLALLSLALALPDVPGSSSWQRLASERLSDQMDHLVVRDGGMAVFVENSVGYHRGVQRLMQHAGALAALGDASSSIAAVAKELATFTKFIRYADGRAPSQGDTFRKRNGSPVSASARKPYAEPAVTVLPRAGYAVVKGNHAGAGFMMAMFATALSTTHKHEDHLSFTLYFDGIEWLIDPSFYSHEYTERISAYLRSAAAHNALTVPDRRYSLLPNLSTLAGEGRDGRFSLRGEHRAYEDMLVIREVQGDLTRLSLVIRDSVQGGVPQAVPLLMLHCGEGVTARFDAGVLVLAHPESRFELHLDLQGGECQTYMGDPGGSLVRGLAGQGFQEVTGICTVECRVPSDTTFSWTIRAEVAP